MDLPSGETDAPDTVALSTGQTLSLPLRTEATMLGATFSASRTDVADRLPDGLDPIRATPGGNAAVTLLSVEYHDIGVDGIEPYNEFSVLFPAVPAGDSSIPVLSLLSGAAGGYVWTLPVTTEPAKALGTDVWGYPKVVADITHEDEGDRRETTVTMDGERFLTMSVARPPAIRRSYTTTSYAVKDGTLLRIPMTSSGRLGGWPLSTKVSVSLGSHPQARVIEELSLGGRALARLSFEGEVVFHPGEPVA